MKTLMFPSGPGSVSPFSAPPLVVGPFRLADPGRRPPAMRALDGLAGIGDRLRVAAFAELQARDAFQWAADALAGDSVVLRKAWLALARAEDRHLGWLLDRMDALSLDVRGRPVSPELYGALTSSTSVVDFAGLMASAEERGRVAGERFEARLRDVDPTTAALFGQIAREEAAHIRLAERLLRGDEVFFTDDSDLL